MDSVLSPPRSEPAPSAAPRPDRRALLWLLLLLAVALGLRLVLLVRSGWLLEGDDSLSTLMGLAILEGDRPIMLKNQTYAAAWEPYMMALSYALFGVSRVAAKLPALLGSLALIGSTWLLTREAAGRTAGHFAALLVAIPGAYFLVMTLKPWAPYTEVMILGSLALVAAMRLAFPRPGTRDLRWAFGGGAAGGLAFWMHPLAVEYLAAAGLLVLLRVRGGRLLRLAGWGAFGFAVGALPVWLYNLQTGGGTLRYIARGTGGQTADRWEVLQAWWANDLPRGLGLWHPWGAAMPLAWVVAAIVVVAVGWAVFVRPWRPTGLRPLDGLLLLLLTIPAVLVFSGFGGPALNPWGFDATGRYTPPIWNAAVPILGAFLAWLWARRRAVAATIAGLVVVANLWGYATVSPTLAFQSPYWPKLPVDNGPLLGALREDGIAHVWINHWVGLPLMFDARAAGQPLLAYDWYDVQAGGVDRYPEYRPLIEQAERQAFVLVTDEAEPELVQRLRDLGVSFREQRVGPYAIVEPTSRRVHPSEVTQALDFRY